jgi:hypothetical protein
MTGLPIRDRRSELFERIGEVLKTAATNHEAVERLEQAGYRAAPFSTQVMGETVTLLVGDKGEALIGLARLSGQWEIYDNTTFPATHRLSVRARLPWCVPGEPEALS